MSREDKDKLEIECVEKLFECLGINGVECQSILEINEPPDVEVHLNGKVIGIECRRYTSFTTDDENNFVAKRNLAQWKFHDIFNELAQLLSYKSDNGEDQVHFWNYEIRSSNLPNLNEYISDVTFSKCEYLLFMHNEFCGSYGFDGERLKDIVNEKHQKIQTKKNFNPETIDVFNELWLLIHTGQFGNNQIHSLTLRDYVPSDSEWVEIENSCFQKVFILSMNKTYLIQSGRKPIEYKKGQP